MTDSTVTVAGNATRDPELRYTAGGQPVASFGVAVNRRWQNRQTNEWEEQVSFFDVTCWGALGENVAETVTKGARVVVVGRLEQRSWDTQDGEKRSKIEIVADEVGPSLRWATATIDRNPSGGTANTHARRPAANTRNAGRNAGRDTGRSPAQQDNYDEEPF